MYIELRPFNTATRESVVVGDRVISNKNKYLVSTFRIGDLSERFNPTLDDDFCLKGSLEENMANVFQESLALHVSRDADYTIDFDVSPGKMVFLFKSKMPLTCKMLCSSNGYEYLKDLGISSFYTPNLNPDYLLSIQKTLKELSFENLDHA